MDKNILEKKLSPFDTCVIRRINFQPGSKVVRGDIIFEVETSKTIIEIPADCGGIIEHSLSLNQEIKLDESVYIIRPDEVSIEGVEKNVSNGKHSLNGALKFTEPSSIVKEISKRKKDEINNLLKLDHGSSTSVLSVSIKIPGERIISAPFIFANSISDILVFEAAKLISKYPDLNSYFLNSDSYVSYLDVNFGWAFDNGKNLKVLTIKNTQKLSLSELQEAVFDLLKTYETEDKLPIDLTTGSTITFTDLSRTGVNNFIPLINGRQSLILGVTNEKNMLFQIIAAYDHRVSDGLTVANFLQELKTRILSYYLDDNGMAAIMCYACEKTIAEEVLLRHRGFIKITLPNGEEANLCRSCFEGW